MSIDVDGRKKRLPPRLFARTGDILSGLDDGQEAGRVEVETRFSLGSPTQEIWVGWLISLRRGDNRGWRLARSGYARSWLSCLHHDVHAVEQARCAPKVSLLSSHTSGSQRISGYDAHPRSSVSVCRFLHTSYHKKRVTESSAKASSELKQCAAAWSPSWLRVALQLACFMQVESRHETKQCQCRWQRLPLQYRCKFRFHICSVMDKSWVYADLFTAPRPILELFEFMPGLPAVLGRTGGCSLSNGFSCQSCRRHRAFRSRPYFYQNPTPPALTDQRLAVSSGTTVGSLVPQARASTNVLKRAPGLEMQLGDPGPPKDL